MVVWKEKREAVQQRKNGDEAKTKMKDGEKSAVHSPYGDKRRKRKSSASRCGSSSSVITQHGSSTNGDSPKHEKNNEGYLSGGGSTTPRSSSSSVIMGEKQRKRMRDDMTGKKSGSEDMLSLSQVHCPPPSSRKEPNQLQKTEELPVLNKQVRDVCLLETRVYIFM